MCNELIEKLENEARYNTIKAIGFKCLDNTLYIGSHLISLTILILGIYAGSASTSSNNNNNSTGSTGIADNNDYQHDSWFFITGVLGGVNGVIIELSKRYNFKKRSEIIYECSREYLSKITTLRQLKVDPAPGEKKLVQIHQIELEISDIQLKSFSIQVIKSTPPTIIATH
jgi:hypothetical protein